MNVVHDFSFADRVKESGITFRNRIVDDAGRSFTLAHYDHGNGIAIADVDGDGRHDIYFVTQVGGNELWGNLGRGKFENITERAGVAVRERISVTASFADIDNDGDADLYVTTVRGGNVLFENDGTGVFTDISANAGCSGTRGNQYRVESDRTLAVSLPAPAFLKKMIESSFIGPSTAHNPTLWTK